LGRLSSKNIDTLKKHFSNIPESDNEQYERKIYFLVGDMIEEVNSIREQLRWRRLGAHDLPPLWESVLVRDRFGKVDMMCLAASSDVGPHWFDGQNIVNIEHISAWRPIPEGIES